MIQIPNFVTNNVTNFGIITLGRADVWRPLDRQIAPPQRRTDEWGGVAALGPNPRLGVQQAGLYGDLVKDFLLEHLGFGLVWPAGQQHEDRDRGADTRSDNDLPASGIFLGHCHSLPFAMPAGVWDRRPPPRNSYG